MTSTKYIGMDVHKESISISVRNALGKVVMESVIETKASTIVQFIDGLRGDLRVTRRSYRYSAIRLRGLALAGSDLVSSYQKGAREAGPLKQPAARAPSSRTQARKKSFEKLEESLSVSLF